MKIVWSSKGKLHLKTRDEPHQNKKIVSRLIFVKMMPSLT
jgi:hypothetical protein